MSALLRMATRNVVRSWRQQLLVVLLIAVPVGLGSYAAVGERTVMLSSDESFDAQFGAAELGTWTDGDEIDVVVDALVDAGADVLVIRRLQLDEMVTDVDLDHPLAVGLVRRVEGRTPERAGEIALSLAAARSRELELGGTLTTRYGTTAEVVGVITPRSPSDVITYLPPGSLATVGTMQANIGYSGLGLPEARELSERLRSEGYQLGYQSRSSRVGTQHQPLEAGLIVTVALLVEAALLAATAFAIRGRRRVVEFGRLLAIGAGPDEIRRLVLVEAAVLGAAAAAMGVGIAAMYATTAPQHLEWFVNNVSGWEREIVLETRISPLDLAGPALLAVVAAVIAAWVPARAAGNLGAVQALASGASRSELSRWMTPLALAGAVCGGGLIAVAAAAADAPSGSSALALIGLVVLVGSGAVAAAAALQWLERSVAPRLPVIFRWAVRDSARHRARSASALTGTALVVGLVVMIMTLASPDRLRPTSVSGPEASVAVWGDNGFGGPAVDLAAPAAGLPPISAVADNLEVGRTFPLISAAGPGSIPFQPWGPDVAPLTVIDDELAAALDLSLSVQAALAQPSTIVDLAGWGPPVGPDGQEARRVGDIEILAVGPDDLTAAEEQLRRLGEGFLISPDGAAALGVALTETGLIVVGDGPFTPDELARLHDMKFRVPSRIQVGPPTSSWVRNQLVAAAVAAALVAVLYRIMAALIATEIDPSLSTMISVGGSSRLRPALVGAQTIVHLSVAVAMAIPAGVLLGYAIEKAGAGGGDLAPPWALMAAMALLPLAVAGFVAATTGPGVPVLSHRRPT